MRVSTNLDDLELELRKLPGVRAAGFTERDDVLIVQVQVVGEEPPPNLALQATRIAYRHSDKPATIEVVRWRTAERAEVRTEKPAPAPVPPILPGEEEERERRVRLLAVLTFPDTDELEVHLTFEGRRIIGRAVASRGMLGVVEATIDGLHAFAPMLELVPVWARELGSEEDEDTHVVACELSMGEDGRLLGVAAGASPIEAAARASLHALNRSIATRLVEAQPSE